MNRPFTAFGALLALLALAMFAVSSPDRSTTVQSQPQNRPRTVASNPCRIASTVAAQAGAEIDNDAGNECCIDTDCSRVCCNELCTALARSVRGRRVEIAPARVQTADNMAESSRWPEEVDCRSHYDAAYDRLVYGFADEDLPRSQPRFATSAIEPATGDGDWLATFQSLVVRKRQLGPPSQAKDYLLKHGGSSGCLLLSSAVTVAAMGRGPVGAGLGMVNPRSILVSFSKWLAQRIDTLARDWGMTWGMSRGETIGWADYAELIDRVSQRGATSSFATGTSERRQGVRSGDWLRHSAASSLYQFGAFLQAAGLQLEGAASE